MLTVLDWFSGQFKTLNQHVSGKRQPRMHGFWAKGFHQLNIFQRYKFRKHAPNSWLEIIYTSKNTRIAQLWCIGSSCLLTGIIFEGWAIYFHIGAIEKKNAELEEPDMLFKVLWLDGETNFCLVQALPEYDAMIENNSCSLQIILVVPPPFRSRWRPQAAKTLGWIFPAGTHSV